MHTPHPRRGDAPLPSPRMECLQNHVDSPAEQIPSSPRFLINHLVMSVWTRGCLLYTSGHDPVRLCSVAEPAPALALGSSFGWLRCPPDRPIRGGCSVLFPSTFLPLWHKVLQAYPGHFLLLSESRHFSREPGSLPLEVV